MPEGPNGRVFVIFNPASGRGRGQKRLDYYRGLLSKHVPGYEHAITTFAGEERMLARRALSEGFDTVVGVGGDGTWSHVAEGLLSVGQEAPRMGILPAGTGNDFGRSYGLDFGDPEGAVCRLAQGRVVSIDVGRVLNPSREVNDPDGGALAPRHFLNLVGFGFDIAVIDAAADARLLKGEILYKVTALQQLFRFPGVEVTIENSEGLKHSGPHLMVTVSNAPFFGGGVPIAPGATLTDGALHACLIQDAGPLTRANLFGAAQKGTHVESDRVDLVASDRFSLTFTSPPRFEIDGDLFVSETDTVEVEVVSNAIELVGG